MATENVLNTIAEGTVLEGKITTKGDIRVEGRVIGTITCDAKLVIGEKGSVEGVVDARNAYIAGSVKGQVVVRELLQLQANGHINGDIYTQKLSVQVGATFTGNCRMGQEAKNMLSESQTRIEAENERRRCRQSPKKNGINGHSGVEDRPPREPRE
ncbi:MAG: polymer-forming cytoskeletal protein [Bacteroidia bacterium]